MQRQRGASAQAYRDNEIGRREVDAIHKKVECEMKLSLKTFGGSRSGIQDKLSCAKRSSGSKLLLNASVRAQYHHTSFQGGICGAASGKCNLVRKPYANLPGTPVALTGASKYFHMLPVPPGALQSALRLCKSILTCS